MKKMGKKKDEKTDDDDGDDTIWDWKKDLDEWCDDLKQALPSGDGHTVYPEKMSCKHGEKDQVKNITQVLLGRAGAFRKGGFHLPNGERWYIPDEERVVIVDCAWGWLFTAATGLRAGVKNWVDECIEAGVMDLQETLSDSHGWAVCGVKTKELPSYWYGRPKRAGGRYVVAGSKEGVE
tara:strand:+ start:169 stop:705 length:537 start_codon:yes stop_codon:yes gene_type:complete